ncbi:MAG: DNA repair protein RadC [Clostridia bacterium]|nr:DNA repair protein RadC [Clostridia bacterium]
MSDHMHDGHRLRMKEQFLKSGMDSLSSHQVLEILLYYSVPRVDTNPLAHRLIDHFGGLSEVLDADFDQLRQVKGVSENTATHLVFVSELLRRYHCEKTQERKSFRSLDEVGKYLQAQYTNEKNEKLRILCFNNRGNLLHTAVISEGGLVSTSVNIRRIMEVVLRYPTTSVVMAHNHPAGFAIPSSQDYDCTVQVRRALESLQIELSDHIVFAENDFVSMRQTAKYAGAFSKYARDDSALEWLRPIDPFEE